MATAWHSYDRLVVHFSGGVRGINHFEDNQLYFLPVIRKGSSGFSVGNPCQELAG